MLMPVWVVCMLRDALGRTEALYHEAVQHTQYVCFYWQVLTVSPAFKNGQEIKPKSVKNKEWTVYILSYLQCTLESVFFSLAFSFIYHDGDEGKITQKVNWNKKYKKKKRGILALNSSTECDIMAFSEPVNPTFIKAIK